MATSRSGASYFVRSIHRANRSSSCRSGEHLAYGDTQAIPSREAPNDLIAVYWTDLDPSQAVGGGIFSFVDQGRFVVEWHAIPLWDQVRANPTPCSCSQLSDSHVWRSRMRRARCQPPPLSCCCTRRGRFACSTRRHHARTDAAMTCAPAWRLVWRTLMGQKASRSAGTTTSSLRRERRSPSRPNARSTGARESARRGTGACASSTTCTSSSRCTTSASTCATTTTSRGAVRGKHSIPFGQTLRLDSSRFRRQGFSSALARQRPSSWRRTAAGVPKALRDTTHPT